MGESKPSGRPTHEVETDDFKITTTRVVIDHLKRLVATGYYGKSHNEAAEQIVREKLREMVGEDELKRLIKNAKPAKSS